MAELKGVCIGGPLDKQIIESEAPFVGIPIPLDSKMSFQSLDEDFSFETAIYQRAILHFFNAGELIFYIYSDISTNEAMEMLRVNYCKCENTAFMFLVVGGPDDRKLRMSVIPGYKEANIDHFQFLIPLESELFYEFQKIVDAY